VGASDGKFVLPLAAAGHRVPAIERDPFALHGGPVRLPDGTEARSAGLIERLKHRVGLLLEWQLGDVAFDFATWPDPPTFLEFEGPDEQSVRQAAEKASLDYTEARFGSVDAIYKSEASRDILAEPTLLFTDAVR